MAIDTENKRRGAMGHLFPLRLLPVPGITIGGPERRMLGGLYPLDATTPSPSTSNSKRSGNIGNSIRIGLGI